MKNGLGNITRTRELLKLLQSSVPYTARLLADKLNVTQRTVTRDIQWLREHFGYNIEYQATQRRYVAYPSTDGNDLELGIAEALALYLSAEALGRMGDEYHRTLLKKICTVLQRDHDSVMHVNLAAISQPITFALSQTQPIATAHVKSIVEGIGSCKSLRIQYNSVRSAKSTWRIVDPYHLYCRYGTWYLIARCHTRKEMLLFRTDRITEVTPTTKIFKKTAFDITEYLDDSLQMYRGDTKPIQIELRARGLAVRWFQERTFHSTQNLTVNTNGTATITMTVVRSPDLENWILGWGEEIEVVSPSELRQRLKERIAGMGRVYEKQ